MAGIFDGRFNTTIPAVSGGILQGRFDPEVKVEEQTGEPTKTTTIMRPQSPEPETALEQSFNPMELWQNVSAVVDAEMMTQSESDQKAEQIQAMTERTRNPGESGISVPQMQSPVVGGWPDVQVDTGVPTTPPMPADGPIPHILGNVPPQGQRPGQPLPDPTAGMPYPPSVFPTSDMPGHPHELGGRPPWNQGNPYLPMEFGQVGVPQGTPPGQPLVDPTAGEEYIGGQYFGEGSQRPTFDDLQTQNRPEFTDLFTPEEKNIMTQAGISEGEQKMNAAAIKTAASDNNGTSTVDGKDASTDPMMWEQWGNLAQNPTARKADYLKQMNMIILGGIMLDAMAAAMGVKSESGKYIEAQLRMMEEAMKFDDQQHIYDLGRSVYYNEDGTYNPAKTQAEVFDRLMQSGATVAEAQAMSSKHPKSPGANGWDAYYKPREDGTIETMYVPKDTTPPGEPWTDNAANARHQTSRADEDKSTAAMKDEALVNEWNAQIQALEAVGRMEEANALRIRRDNLKNRSGMAAKVGSSDARNLFTALYKSRMGDAYSDPNYFQDPVTQQDIPFDEFYNMWLNAYELQVLDGGVPRTVPGYRKQQPSDPSQSMGQATNSEIALPGQRTVEQRLKVAQDELREQIGLGVYSPEVLIKAWLATGWTPEDLPEEYK